jgi:DNA replication protein DnaC
MSRRSTIANVKVNTINDVPEALRTMHLSAMAAALQEDMNDPNSSLKSFDERIMAIVSNEVSYRKNRKYNRKLKDSNIKMKDADLNDLDTTAKRTMDMNVLNQLKTCEWIKDKLNLIITGPCGSGKTWIGCALGVRACQMFMNVRYYSTDLLITKLKTYEPSVYLDKLTELSELDLLILDDVGLQSFDLASCRIFFEVLDSRYKNGSTMFISQFPVSAWHDLFADKTYANGILSRNLEHACRLEIQSEDLRLKA